MRLRQGALLLLALATLGACERSVPFTPVAQPTLAGLGSALTPGPVRVANRDLADDLVDLVFNPENGPELARLLRFEMPVRVALVDPGLQAFAADLDRLLARIAEGAGIDIARTASAEAASVQVRLAPRREMADVFPGAQCFILPARLTWPEFRAALDRDELPDWGDLERLEAATIFIPGTATPSEVRECLEEEIAQALGPANDLFRLPDTVFNDDNVHVNLTRFDLMILRGLYDPALRSGMTRVEARAGALSAFDAANPEGREVPRRRTMRPDAVWENIVRQVFSGDLTREEQRAALRRALARAEKFPQPDHRLAFTLDMLASLEYQERPELSEGLLQRALDSLERYFPPGDLRTATIRLYLGQARLRLGRPDAALRLADAALPVLAAHDVPVRIAHAFQVRSSALGALGREEEALDAAIDSLRWARYAHGAEFGNLAELEERLEELRAIRPPGG
jgi:hypothetical protein